MADERELQADVRVIEFEAMLLGRHLSPSSTQRTAELFLDRSVYTLLSRLSIDGPMSIGELGEAFGLDVSTLNRQTASTLRSGLVERIPDPNGGIARKFRVTPEGRRRLEADRRLKVRSLTEVLEEWTPADVSNLAEVLQRFNRDIEDREGRPWPRSNEGIRRGRALRVGDDPRGDLPS